MEQMAGAAAGTGVVDGRNFCDSVSKLPGTEIRN